VEVLDVLDARDRFRDLAADDGDVQIVGRPLEQDVRGLADQPPGRKREQAGRRRSAAQRILIPGGTARAQG
jgi:hypothetical protein